MLQRAVSAVGGGGVDISDIIGQTYELYTRALASQAMYTVGISTLNVRSGDSPINIYSDVSATTLIDSVSSTSSNKDIDVSAYNVVFFRCNSSYANVSACYLTVVD